MEGAATYFIYTALVGHAIAPITLRLCAKLLKCRNECRHVSLQARLAVREQYDAIRADLRKGAKYRGYCFIFQRISKVRMLKVPGKLVKHMDAQYGMQQCSHCMFDDQTKWDPAHSHGYMYCNRRGEKHNNSYLRNRFGLIDDEEDHSVCATFFADTFEISKTTLLLLTSYAGKAMLPPDIFPAHGGYVPRFDRKQLVREYIGTIPRHFSHYSPAIECV